MEVGGISGWLTYRFAWTAAVVTTRFRPCAGGWTTGPSPGWLLLSAGGAPSARCSTGSTPPMPAPHWWAARRTSAPPPKTVPGVRPGPATLRDLWERLLAGPPPRRFCWWIWPWLWACRVHPSLVTHGGHLCCQPQTLVLFLTSTALQLAQLQPVTITASS